MNNMHIMFNGFILCINITFIILLSITFINYKILVELYVYTELFWIFFFLLTAVLASIRDDINILIFLYLMMLFSTYELIIFLLLNISQNSQKK